MQKVLVFAGTKQSGKSTAAKFVHGYRMREAGVIKWFDISQEGELMVNAVFSDANGNPVETNNAVLDIYRQDYEFAQYAMQAIWPLAKVYSFASELKDSCIRIFSLNPQYIYGTDDDKNQPTNIKWGNIWSLVSENRQKEIKESKILNTKEIQDRFITHRELLQEFGTICRIIDPDCWLRACWNRIREEGFPFCIIDDCRYENEVDYCAVNNAYIVLLGRQPFKNDNHSSEKIHNVAKSKFNYIISENLTMSQKNEEIVKILSLNGWTSAKLG